MKLFIMAGMVFLSCGTVKTNPSSANSDSSGIYVPAEKTVKDSLNSSTATVFDLPKCIKNKIDSFKKKDAYEQPQKVVAYLYKGQRVFYIEMQCCDFFNEVYDSKCNFLGSPDGGFTGKGDGKLPDFFKVAKEEKLIWKKPE